MKTLETIEAVREFLQPHRRAGRRIGFVPTMGALHAGHRSLFRAARADCDVVATWDDGDPMIATGRFGDGRVLAYTSDPAPHWGSNFVFWDQYPQLWLNALNWLLTD